jgi:hypothetical protein
VKAVLTTADYTPNEYARRIVTEPARPERVLDRELQRSLAVDPGTRLSDDVRHRDAEKGREALCRAGRGERRREPSRRRRSPSCGGRH